MIICTDTEHVLMHVITREPSDTVVYPLLCKLVLQLTAAYQMVVDCSADDTVITSVLFWLISVARKSNVTTLCMYQQVLAYNCQHILTGTGLQLSAQDELIFHDTAGVFWYFESCGTVAVCFLP